MHDNAEQVQILSRRSKVASLLLRGVRNQLEICSFLGMGPGQRTTISRDITALKKQWCQSGLRDFDEAKGLELEKLDVLEREYWDAWERSKVEKMKTRTRRRTRGVEQSEEQDAEIRKERGDGDPRFLAGVLDCIKKRCDILGLDAPTQLRHGGDADAPPIRHECISRYTPERLAALSDDQLAREHLAALADSRRYRHAGPASN